MSTASTILVIPHFHYDVAYLRRYEEYLPICLANIDEALRILAARPEYRFLVEQTILLEEYWRTRPERREELKGLAAAGRLSISPGMYVMPDMNLIDAESLLRQIELGRRWLREHLEWEPEVCWIADCWGHPAQLPQLLSQAGYKYYVFWRGMRREVLRGDFRWRAPDGTEILTHWLARGYGNLIFPTDREVGNARDLDLAGCGPEKVRGLARELGAFSPGQPVLLGNGGDFLFPQATAPDCLAELQRLPEFADLRFATPDDGLKAIDWTQVPLVEGEFNSLFHGTYTTNIDIKRDNRRLVRELLSLETLAAVRRREPVADSLWRPILKQQFHDIICGTIADGALRDSRQETALAAAALAEARRELAGLGGAYFNPAPAARTEIVDLPAGRAALRLPPLGCAAASAAEPLPAASETALPLEFANEWYSARISADGHLTSLRPGNGGAELLRGGRPAAGTPGLQLDYGDSWLNFAGPISGGSFESGLANNVPDPWDGHNPADLVFRGTVGARITKATARRRGETEVEIEQEGEVSFWRLRVPFKLRLRLNRFHPRLEYTCRLFPTGRHYRLRVGFPTTIVAGRVRHEVAAGVQERGPGEHSALTWADYADAEKGLALFNRGLPGNNTTDGIMMLTLFRAAAMEYKTESELSFGEGTEQLCEYALLPHGPDADEHIIHQAEFYTAAPLACAPAPQTAGDVWGLEPGTVRLQSLRSRPEGLLARLVEMSGQAQTAKLKLPAWITGWAEADALGRTSGQSRPVSGELALPLTPWQVKTIWLK